MFVRQSRGKLLFFGPLGPYSITQLSRKTGIPERTLYAYRKDPDNIPAGKLRLLFKAVGASPENVLRFFK